MDPIKVHLDTDIGGRIDDLCALALLLHWPNVEITGVTTVLENRGRRAGYARHVLDQSGRSDVPVAAGADVTLGCFRQNEYVVLPEDRYWPEPVAPTPGPLDAALDLLQRSINDGSTIVAIGPLTNLSLLELRSPGALREGKLCLMGGSLAAPPEGFPVWSHERDFNVQADRHAAKHVLDTSDPERTTLVPIEVTTQTALRRAHLSALRAAGPLGALLARQAAAFAEDESYEMRYGAWYAGLPPDIINFQHDPLTCAVALGWDGVAVETRSTAAVLEGDWLRTRIAAGAPLRRIVARVDGPAFNQLWLDVVTERAV